MTCEEIEKRMDELARKYVETHDKKIIEELYKFALELRNWIEKAKPKQQAAPAQRKRKTAS
jgi:hypothetical protein